MRHYGIPSPSDKGLGSVENSPAGSGAKPRPKTDLEPFDLEIWPVVIAFN